MAIINSYPLITPLNKDLLIGTEVYDPITQLPTGGSRTVTFSISSIVALISSNPYVLPVASVAALGGVRLFNDTVNDVEPEAITTTANRNYVVELSTDNKMLVNVPWTGAPYTLPVATSTDLGGVKIGYTQTATRDYPVTLDAEKMLVTVPWTDTGVTGSGIQFTLPMWDNVAGTNLGDSIISQLGTATLSVTGTGAGTLPDLTVENTGDSYYGARITLQHNSVSPANGDNVGQIYFQGKDSAGGIETFASIIGYAQDVSSTNEEGVLSFQTRTNTSQATNTQKMKIGNNGNIKFNSYGSGTITGTATYNLSVDTSGNVIETANPSTSLLKTVTNSFTDSQILLGGSLTFTMPAVPVGKQLLIQNTLFYMAVRPQAGGPVYFNAGTGYSIQLQFDDGFSNMNILPLSNAQAFLNQGNSGQILMSNSISGSDYPFVLGDVVSTGGGTMNLELSAATAGQPGPTTGNGELYVSIEYKEIATGSAFTL